MNTSRFSKGGLVVVVINFLIAVPGYEDGRLSVLTFVSLLGAGCALLVRSFRPPLSFGRGLATWWGGSFSGSGGLGVWYFISDLWIGYLGKGFGESLFLMVVGIPLSFLLLRYGFKSIQFSKEEIAKRELEKREEIADAEFKKASKLEAQGQFKEAAVAYQNILEDFGDTTVAKDAESGLALLEIKLKEIKIGE